MIKSDINSMKNLPTRHTYSTYANELSSLRIFCKAQTSCAKSALLRSPTRYIVWGRTICPAYYGTKLFLKSNFNFEKNVWNYTRFIFSITVSGSNDSWNFEFDFKEFLTTVWPGHTIASKYTLTVYLIYLYVNGLVWILKL